MRVFFFYRVIENGEKRIGYDWRRNKKYVLISEFSIIY